VTTPAGPETCLFRVEVPAGTAHGGRLVARWLKYGLRFSG
jgi:hypothetical protein